MANILTRFSADPAFSLCMALLGLEKTPSSENHDRRCVCVCLLSCVLNGSLWFFFWFTRLNACSSDMTEKTARKKGFLLTETGKRAATKGWGTITMKV